MTLNALTKVPSRSRPDTFDDDADQHAAELVAFQAQFNAEVAGLNVLFAGGAYSIPYTFDVATADTDPGSGNLRLSSGTQNASTVVRVDTTSNLADCTSLLDTFALSTNPVKGTLALVKRMDPKQFLLFDVTAVASPVGYRNISVTPRASSAASPFAVGDSLMLYFQRAGDKGDKGDTANGFSNMVIMRSLQSWTPPAGITKAEITLVDGGQGGGSSNTSGASPGRGGDASVSIRTVNPAVTYVASVGSGGQGAASGSGAAGSAGGASSFSGNGFTTLNSSNGDLKVSGEPGLVIGTLGYGGASMWGGRSSANAASTDIGQGGGGADGLGNAGKTGGAGAIIIRY